MAVQLPSPSGRGPAESLSGAWMVEKRTKHEKIVGWRIGSSLLGSFSSRNFSSFHHHQTMESGSIASWTLSEGDSFAAGDVFCSVETDKATVDFEAQDDGVLAKILVPAGPAEIQCGQPIMITVDDEGDVPAFAEYKAAAAVEAPKPVEAAPPAAAAAPAPTPAAPVAAAPTPVSGGERVVASPLAHMLANELGYDITAIPGTGPGGRVIAADVKEFTPSTSTSATSAPAQQAMTVSTPIPGAGYKDYPVPESARALALQLQQAKRNVPHYYLTVDVRVDALLKTRETLNASLGEEPLSVYDFLLKAAAKSMQAVPTANASWMDSVVRVYDHVDLNVVVGSGEDLATPVIANAGALGLQAISKQVAEAVNALEDGTPVASGVGTFTVMNLGMYGVKSCAPIIREPQACALAIGALENRIVPNDDPEAEEIYQESVVFTATLSCDHRVVDGAVGAQWLAAFKSHVENPATLLL